MNSLDLFQLCEVVILISNHGFDLSQLVLGLL
jgi:hypothetical protein